MFKKSAISILAMSFLTMLHILAALIVQKAEYSEAAALTSFESYDPTYPDDTIPVEDILLAPETPVESALPTDPDEVEMEEYEEAEPERESNEELEELEELEEEPIAIAPVSESVVNRTELDAAFATANDGDTIVLGADIFAEEHTIIPINANIILTSEVGSNFTFTVTTQRHFIVNSGSTLRLENITLSGDLSQALAHGGVEVDAGGYLYLGAGSVIENSRADSGGGVQVNNNGALIIGGGVIRNNTSTSNSANDGGGGVNAVGTNSRIHMISGEISGNSVLGTVNTIGGAGVRIDGGQFLMDGGTISGNTITGRYGGGVAVAGGGSFTMEGGAISSNSARAGGGVNIGNPSSAGTFIMKGGTISGNNVTGTATDDGGGGVRLHHDNSRFYMYGESMITNHEIARNGGGVRATAGVIYLRGGEISNNRVTVTGTTPHTGAGLHITNAVLTISAGKVSDNRTLGTGAASGGGIHLVSSEFIMSAGEISNNWTSGNGNGGGLHITGAGSTIVMSGGTIIGNEANQGGGLNIEVGAGLFTPFAMSAGRIEDNTARTNGGGMRISGAQLKKTGGVIHDNSAGHAGGGIHFATHALSRVYLHEGALISENASGTVDIGVIARDGGGINMTGGRTYLRGGEISDNIAHGSGANAGQGGGVNLRSSSVLTIESGTIAGNEAHLGGGVSIFSIGTTFADIIMYDGEISGNTARDQGGGLNVSQGSFEMFEGVIKNNTALTHGGGIRMSGNGIVDIHAGEIRNNNANNHGGGIHIGTGNTGSTANPAGGLLHIRENALIIENIAAGPGGGLNFSGGSLRLHGTLSDNVSGHDGGGVEMSSATDSILNVEIDGALFSGNRAGGAGGAINIQRVNVDNTHIFTIENSEFFNNHANSRGGGIRIGDMGDLTLNDVIVHGNSTYSSGGGIFIGSSFRGTLRLYDGVRIFENVGNNGGGLYQHGGIIDMRGAEISDNTANVNGGGIVLNNAAGFSAGNFTMNDGVINNNTASNGGGGINARSSNSTFNMYGGIIQGNVAFTGGGINVGSASVNINDGTIDQNTARNHGGGMWLALHNNAVYVRDGEFTRNRAEGDGGAIFVTSTRVDNPLVGAVGVYPRLHLIADNVIFSENTAGGSRFEPPDNYYEIDRFDGQLLSNYNINYRSNWRVVFYLYGGTVNGNASNIVHTFQTSWTEEERTIGDLVPVPDEREGYRFLGWRNRDSEPERDDDDWDGVFEIWTHEDVAEHVVDSSTAFEAVWRRRMYTVTYMVVGPEPSGFTPALDTLGGMYPMGTAVTVADGLIPTTRLDDEGRFGLWRFMGWSRDEVHLKSGDEFTVPGGDVIFVGRWIFEYPPRVSFEFHKTGEDLYNVSEWGTPGWLETILRSDAHFSLFRYMGEGTPASGIVTEAMITAGTWEYVDSAISSGDIGTPIEFRIIPAYYYHLVEILPPTGGYTLPQGQWRIVAMVHDDNEGEAAGFRITSQGDSSTPAFANIGGELENDFHFGGAFFVGNRLDFTLPGFGGSGVSIMTVLTGLLMVMAAVGFAVWYMIKRKILPTSDATMAKYRK